jgi:hypothetical protein
VDLGSSKIPNFRCHQILSRAYLDEQKFIVLSQPLKNRVKIFEFKQLAK